MTTAIHATNARAVAQRLRIALQEICERSRAGCAPTHEELHGALQMARISDHHAALALAATGHRTARDTDIPLQEVPACPS